MALEKYKRMRDFGETPEPEGRVEAGKGKLRFVIQKHDASHLHYDFRLEMEGVLKSWAVPKGPSFNPADKRLAMMTEDHPMSYRTFEGIIPEGNYGAGEVVVWDIGTYLPLEALKKKISVKEQEKILLAELHKGALKFFLEGKKLKGAWTLVKIKNSRDGKDNSWLLIKERDAFVSEKDVSKEVKSVLSERILTRDGGASFGEHSPRWESGREIAGKTNKAAGRAARPAKPKKRGNDPMPREVRPMLATLVDASFDRKGWIFELKFDGYRAIGEVRSGKAELYSRNLNSFNGSYPAIVQALETLGHDAVLDGEVVSVDEKGKSQFQYLQHYGEEKKGSLLYYVFDLLYLDGENLTSRPLLERKELLRKIIPVDSLIRYSDHVEEKGKAFFAIAERQGLEGIIAKDGASPYLGGRRSEAWLKIKTTLRQEAVIGGFTEPRGSRKKFGALVLGVYDKKGNFIYIGHTGGGFNEKSIAEVHAKLKPLITKAAPFAEVPKTNMPVTWVKPVLVAEIKFSEWTEGGHMRQPIFIDLRMDKPAKEVRKEEAEPAREAVAHEEKEVRPKAKAASPEAGELALTHLDKVFWPKDGYTKGDLIDYYRAVAPVILPHLKDRPESLNRHPNGIEGGSFFQKNTTAKVPSFVETVKLRSESESRTINWILCQNEETLLYLANLGCIELNPWNARYRNPDKPDYLIIDLDPDENDFAEVVQIALVTRKILEKADIGSYPKTSGKSGLHIVVPLKARYSQEQARQFGEIIANLVHAASPANTSVVRDPKKRRGKIYIDFLQNRSGQTIAAPYSARPWPGATVSAPLKWSEVKKGLHPSQFTMKNMPQRIEKVGDLWCPVKEKGTDMIKALRKLAG
jgi:bifunctional non-homologous end joining protein LigD